MPARPKSKNQLTKSPKTDSKNISMITTSKIVWVPIATKLTENTWKLKWKMSKQVKVVLDKSPLTELKTAVVRLEKCPISEMKTAVVKLKRLAVPNLIKKLLEKNPGNDYSRKPLLSESERNAIKLMIIENQKASNASKKKLFIKKTKKLPDYEQRRLTNIRERKTMFANLKNNSLILSASKSERRKIFSIPKRIPKN